VLALNFFAPFAAAGTSALEPESADMAITVKYISGVPEKTFCFRGARKDLLDGRFRNPSLTQACISPNILRNLKKIVKNTVVGVDIGG